MLLREGMDEGGGMEITSRQIPGTISGGPGDFVVSIWYRIAMRRPALFVPGKLWLGIFS
jgi:hypothetical protein